MYAKELLAEGTLRHADREDRRFKGENLAMKGEGGLTADNYVPELQWYEGEIGYYDWDLDWHEEGASFGDIGHFTQMVWRSTTALGCGVATKELQFYNLAYSVCRYDPAGNVTNAGYFAANVMELKPM